LFEQRARGADDKEKRAKKREDKTRMLNDHVSWKSEWRLAKFRDPTGKIAAHLRAGMKVKDAIEAFAEAFVGVENWERNVALNEGLGELIDVLCGLGSPTKWDNANARLGVGDSSTATSPTQTGLQGANKAFKVMDDTYPKRADQTAEWRATFGSEEGNFAWEEYTVVNASDDAGKNLNRCIIGKGTKASGESWTLSLKVTFS